MNNQIHLSLASIEFYRTQLVIELTPMRIYTGQAATAAAKRTKVRSKKNNKHAFELATRKEI